MLPSAIVVVALIFGQATDAPINPEPSRQVADAEIAVSPESQPTPAVDLGFLMNSLEGTWLRQSLDDNRISISGWTEISFTGSSNSNNQLPMGFNYRANEFLLQQNWLRVEQQVVTKNTTETSWGFRSDTILPGSDYVFTLQRGLFDGQLTANNGNPNRYGFDPVQFYGEVFFPTIAQGLDVKFGRIFCLYGMEEIDAPSNALASHSYTFIYNPFTNTGATASLQLTPDWAIMLGATLGPDVFFDPAASPYGVFNLKWAPPQGSDSVALGGVLGSGRYNVSEQFNNPNIVDVVWVHTFDPKLSYTLDALFGYQTNVPALGTATWFGFVNYLTYKFSSKVSGTTRVELFDDIDGQRTGSAGLYTTATAGVNYQPYQWLMLRPEIRYDYNGNSLPFEGKHDLVTATANVLVRW